MDFTRRHRAVEREQAVASGLEPRRPRRRERRARHMQPLDLPDERVAIDQLWSDRLNDSKIAATGATNMGVRLAGYQESPKLAPRLPDMANAGERRWARPQHFLLFFWGFGIPTRSNEWEDGARRGLPTILYRIEIIAETRCGLRFAPCPCPGTKSEK